MKLIGKIASYCSVSKYMYHYGSPPNCKVYKYEMIPQIALKEEGHVNKMQSQKMLEETNQ